MKRMKSPYRFLFFIAKPYPINTFQRTNNEMRLRYVLHSSIVHTEYFITSTISDEKWNIRLVLRNTNFCDKFFANVSNDATWREIRDRESFYSKETTLLVESPEESCWTKLFLLFWTLGLMIVFLFDTSMISTPRYNVILQLIDCRMHRTLLNWFWFECFEFFARDKI